MSVTLEKMDEDDKDSAYVSEVTIVSKKKEKKRSGRKQRYRSQWEHMDDFRGLFLNKLILIIL